MSRARRSAARLTSQRPPAPAFLRIASARRRARSRSADLLLSDVPRCDALSESRSRPSRRAAARARASLLAFAAALMRQPPAAVLSRAARESRAAPALLGRADDSSDRADLGRNDRVDSPDECAGEGRNDRPDSPDRSLQPPSESMDPPSAWSRPVSRSSRSLERLRAPG